MIDRRSLVTVTAASLIGGSISTIFIASQERDISAKQLKSILVANPDILRSSIDSLNYNESRLAKSQNLKYLQKNRLYVYATSMGVSISSIRNVIIEFMDYSCPSCKASYADAKQSLAKLSFIYRQKPILGQASVMAAKAAIIAQIYGDFSRFHEFLMISTDPLTEKLVDKALVYASVDKSVFAKYGDSLLVKQAIERDNNVSNLLNIKATPTFIVNDELIVGYNINQISNAVI